MSTHPIGANLLYAHTGKEEDGARALPSMAPREKKERRWSRHSSCPFLGSMLALVEDAQGWTSSRIGPETDVIYQGKSGEGVPQSFCDERDARKVVIPSPAR